jgi:hypothetical protein
MEIILFILLIIKHFVVDFLAQTPYMYKNKGKFGHWGGIQHSYYHAVITGLLIMWVPTLSVIMFAMIMLTELVLHYSIDFLKVNLTSKWELAELKETHLEIYSDKYFYMFGLDQLLHYLTYVWIIILCMT